MTIEQIKSDIEWEQEQKAKGVKGLRLSLLFIERLKELYSQPKQTEEGDNEVQVDQTSE